MRLAFMGTPEFSVPVLSELLAAGHEIAAVYTRAPKPSGRGHKLTPSPVHQFAQAHGLDVRCPKNFKDEKDRAAFVALDLDVAIVVAYGLILPQAILDTPRYGCLNLHASLLPRWRGAAPIQRAIMAGDAATGVQVMQMEAGLDAGPILLSERVEIKPDDTAASLHDRLAVVAAQLAPRALAALSRDALISTDQADDGVVYAEKINSKEARIDWSRSAKALDCHIRGLSPFPGAWTMMDGVRTKVLNSKLSNRHGAPGEVLEIDERFVVGCGEGALELLIIQRAGKQAQNAKDYLRGAPLSPGAILKSA